VFTRVFSWSGLGYKAPHNNLRRLITISCSDGGSKERLPLGYLLLRAQRAYRLAVDRALLRVHLTYAQFAALALVHLQPGISGAELARRAGVTAQTMNGVVAHLESAGMIARAPHPEHGRILAHQLTTTGEEALERCRGLVEQIDRRMLSGFNTDDACLFEKLLTRAGDALIPRSARGRKQA
jgi:DNA-binding MarR family transcriptional regulator